MSEDLEVAHQCVLTSAEPQDSISVHSYPSHTEAPLDPHVCVHANAHTPSIFP